MSDDLPIFSLFDDGLARRAASLHPQIWPLQTALMSPIPASPQDFRSHIFPDEPDTVQNDGCTVDGRLAIPDARHGGRGTRSRSRNERLPGDDGAFDGRSLPALS